MKIEELIMASRYSIGQLKLCSRNEVGKIGGGGTGVDSRYYSNLYQGLVELSKDVHIDIHVKVLVIINQQYWTGGPAILKPFSVLQDLLETAEKWPGRSC